MVFLRTRPPAGELDGAKVGQRHERDREAEPGHVQQRAGQGKVVDRDGSEGCAPILPPDSPAEPVEGDRTEHDGDEGNRARSGVPEGQAHERRARDDLPAALALTDGKRGHAGEEAEIGRERLAVREPGGSPERRSPHPGDG